MKLKEKIIKIITDPQWILLCLDQKRIVRISDKVFLKIMYKRRMKNKLNLKNPRTFNEKLQWLKLYDRNPEYTKMVDKYEVKQYISDKIGKEYIIPTIGVYDKFEDINFSELPEKFVMKCTHDSGSTIVCRDKKVFDIENAKKKTEKWLKQNFFYLAREWPYKNVKRRIVIEEYMEDNKKKELVDYKFYCFNGIPQYLYVSEGLENHATAKIDFFDMDYNYAPFGRTDYKRFPEKPQKPTNFIKMKELSKILSENIPFVRVDFYEINNQIYFGELTFSPCGGYMPFDPKEYDKKLGDWIDLPKKEEVRRKKYEK